MATAASAFEAENSGVIQLEISSRLVKKCALSSLCVRLLPVIVGARHVAE